VVLPLPRCLREIFYLNGGRYVTTDDAYVGRKGSDHADISGKIEKVVGAKGQRSMKATCC